VGLDPGTLGSWPEPEAVAWPTEPPRCPDEYHFSDILCIALKKSKILESENF